MVGDARKRFLAFARRARDVAGERLEPLFRSRPFAWAAIVMLAVVITAVTTMSLQHIPSHLEVGAIAVRDIKADRNYEIVDEEATSKFRDEAMQGMLPVFDMDAGLGDATTLRVHDAFQAARETTVSQSGTPEEVAALVRAVLAERLGIEITPEQAQTLLAERLSERAEKALAAMLRRGMAMPVIAEGAAAEFKGQGGAIIRRSRDGGTAEGQFDETVINDIGALMTLEQARERISQLPEARLTYREPGVADTLLEMARLLTVPTCTFNRSETNVRREAAASNVKNVILKVNAGEMIIREGARFEPWHIKVLHGISMEKRRGAYHLEFAGTFLLVLLFITLPFVLVERFFRRVRVSHSDHLLMAAVGLSILVLMRFALLLAPAVRDELFFNMTATTLNFAIPVAGGAMLLRMFFGAEIVVMFAMVLSVIAGLFVEADVRFVAFSLVTSIVAAIAISNVDRRSQIIKAGAVTGLAGAATVLGISLIELASATSAPSSGEFVWGLIFAFLSGIGSAFFAMILAPIIESLSGYTSDIKLLELANLNHPLLRELIVRAPGTYHHSHMVGLLGEAAAAAIGANPLLVRVAAYYHDIGKIKKPLYFIENMRPGENRHEKLTPHMSALIVAAHVKDGADLAISSRVPRVIAEMIPQHHGTRRIGIFYDKAKTMEDPEVMRVDPKDFEYPGPKPQSEEAAILMLADVIEAAVRALKEKSPARIQQTVQRVIHDIFNESQLDECDLTLKDLNEIAQAFERTLLGIYHQRIEYTKDMEHDGAEGEATAADPDAQRAPAAPAGSS